MAAAVIRLGTVEFTESIETAAITVYGKNVRLWFNQQFLDSINNIELAAVLVHEALHFLLKHHERTASLKCQTDRFLFNLACEAVVNDLIVACFQDFTLPANPVTGVQLVGYRVHDKSAEQVLEILRQQTQVITVQLGALQTIDDHNLWAPGDAQMDTAGLPSAISLWSEETTEIRDDILKRLGRRDPSYGSSPLGIERPLSGRRQRIRKDLTRFLFEPLWLSTQDETVWSRSDQRMITIYPQVILPSHRERPQRHILIAIDTSGSVPPAFIAAASEVANQKIPNAIVTLIAFDTVVYEVATGAKSLKGGGGTRVQAVEEYAAHRMRRYPDQVFLLTDGFTPAPTPRHPGRWIWILPPWGSADAIPKGSRKEFFEARAVLGGNSL